MTTWPDPARPGVPRDPERDGWHWLAYLDPEMPPQPALWLAAVRRWESASAARMADAWHYLGPCLTPDEAASLARRAEEAEAEAREAMRDADAAVAAARKAALEEAARATMDWGNDVRLPVQAAIAAAKIAATIRALGEAGDAG